MRALIYAALVACALLFASNAMAAGWTTTEGGSVACTAVRTHGTCYVATAGATTSAIAIHQCASWTVTVYGTATSVMPQSCTSRSCTTATNLLSSGLTGSSPNTFVTSAAPFDLIRLVTTDSVTATIKCGR